jgi:hypothetical protein
MTNARIICANTAMDYDKIKIMGTKVKVDSMDKVAEIEAAEKEKMKEKVFFYIYLIYRSKKLWHTSPPFL